MKRTICTAALGLSLFASASAFAGEGYVTANVSLRAGPDSSYPTVVGLRAGTPVSIAGCVDGWSWCDVYTGDDRGWMAGNYLQEEYQGQRVLVPNYGVQIGIPVISFVFGTYWDDHYRNRSWYGQRDHWSQVQPQYGSVTVHHDSHQNSYNNSYSTSHNNTSQSGSAYSPSHSSPTTVYHTTDQSRQAATVTTRPSYQQRQSSNVAPQHSEARQVTAPDNHAGYSKSVEHNAPEARPTAPRTVDHGARSRRSSQSTKRRRPACSPKTIRKNPRSMTTAKAAAKTTPRTTAKTTARTTAAARTKISIDV